VPQISGKLSFNWHGEFIECIQATRSSDNTVHFGISICTIITFLMMQFYFNICKRPEQDLFFNEKCDGNDDRYFFNDGLVMQ
jgi:hypothetical protein